jgi:DNA-binding response OmpR family regulator
MHTGADEASKKMRVLIIDDNADQRAMLEYVLEAEGFEVAAARNGEDALRLLERSPAEAVVTDLFMPDKDGIETIAEMRKMHPSTRIIAMSGWTSMKGADYLGVARQIGADATLRKPFDPQELIRLLRSFPGSGTPQ